MIYLRKMQAQRRVPNSSPPSLTRPPVIAFNRVAIPSEPVECRQTVGQLQSHNGRRFTRVVERYVVADTGEVVYAHSGSCRCAYWTLLYQSAVVAGTVRVRVQAARRRRR